MLVLITYDVSTESKGGRRRLRRLARACEDCGQRVQYSVFECLLEPGQWVELRQRLVDIINEEEDSLRFYRLTKPFKLHIKEYGQFRAVDFDRPLLV